MVMSKQDDEMAVISEAVLGYREGRFPEIIQAIAALKIKAIKHEQNIQVEQLFDNIEELSGLIEDIRSDA